MKKGELVALLLHNVALEHSAIIQYLYHVFLIGEEEITGEIEKIAREEMRHMKWFAQKAVQLGGEVEIKRIEEEIKVEGPDWTSMIRSDVNAEERAIEIYTKQLEEVKDDSVKVLLERVIRDETEHRHEFSELLEKVKDTERTEEEREKADPRTVELVRRLVREEYRVLLSYLHSFFRSRDWEYRDILMDLAIESMVHMGELGEKLGELGEAPDLSMPSVDRNTPIEKHILDEESAGEDYTEGIREIADPDLARLLSWIHVHEEHHRYRLVEFLRRTKRFTVGDLKGRRD